MLSIYPANEAQNKSVQQSLTNPALLKSRRCRIIEIFGSLDCIVKNYNKDDYLAFVATLFIIKTAADGGRLECAESEIPKFVLL